jgi:DNA-directed RNA polymerase subunit beta
VAGTSVTERLSFAKIREALPIEELDLVAIQRDSFDWLLEEGLQAIFDEISPIEDTQGRMQLSFMNHRFEDPKYSVEECKEKDYTYARPLFVTAEFLNKDDGTIKSQTVFMGDFPVMSDKGTFIINGTERVVVSQLVRSPGVYYDSSIDKATGRDVFGCKVIPGRGAWLEFEADKRDMLGVRVDRKRKQPISVFYRALKAFEWNDELGRYELAPPEVLQAEVDDEEIIDFFGGRDSKGDPIFPSIQLTLDKDNTDRTPAGALEEIYRKLRPGEPPSADQAGQLLLGMFFSNKKYDLQRVGRYKILGLTDDGSGHVKHGKLTDEFEALGFARREEHVLTREDCLATMSYLVKLHFAKTANPSSLSEEARAVFEQVRDAYDVDDIDHFGNRRLRSVGELIQNQVRIGLSRMERVVRERMTTQDLEAITPQTLINIRPVVSAIREFFGTSQLSQFMDQTNPLAGLTHKRRLSALGPGGLSRERAGFEVRDVHPSHYGRMCPIETPEGPNIGLIGSLATYARINTYGFIETPYRVVKDGRVTDEIEYLTADEEDRYVVAQANAPIDARGRFENDYVLVRSKGGEVREVTPEQVDYMDVSPRQIVSISAALIPFLEHDDANRALMGANMQRQAVPLLRADSPYVGTGIEGKAARDAGDVVLANTGGVVVEVAADHIVIKTDDDQIDRYYLTKFERSNQGTCLNQKPIVVEGQRVQAGQAIADGPSTHNGELALGRNLLVAFMSWEGYNYEDAIIISERLVREDMLTSIHIEQLEIDARETKLGPEEITRDIPNVSEDVLANLDEEGIIRIGAEVQPGDILVGKVTPKGETELTPEERLLRAIFGEKAREVRDTSLKVPHGDRGIVIGVQRFSRADGDELQPGVNDLVRVYVATKRKITEGDKLAGRHGNKGVISKVLPVEDMPFLADGTPVDIVLNPLGVPSRMNVGQVLETHLGWAAANGWHFVNPDTNRDKMPDWFADVDWGSELTDVQGPVRLATPVFDGCTPDTELNDLLINTRPTEDGVQLVKPDGKATLIDGRSGEPIGADITVGYVYVLKLHHLVDDKIHARSTGPYSMITQQPLGGKAQFGGQRFGEMEVWALEAYGAAYALQELLTIKSDDVLGRVKVYEAIVKGENIPEPGIPESFKVLVKEMQSLALNVEVLAADGSEIELRESEDDAFRAAESLGIDLSRPERPAADA